MSKDKRITTRQAVQLVQDAYDRFEALAKQALREEFGFGPARLARFEERFSELAAEECLRIEAKVRREKYGNMVITLPAEAGGYTLLMKRIRRAMKYW